MVDGGGDVGCGCGCGSARHPHWLENSWGSQKDGMTHYCYNHTPLPYCNYKETYVTGCFSLVDIVPHGTSSHYISVRFFKVIAQYSLWLLTTTTRS